MKKLHGVDYSQFSVTILGLRVYVVFDLQVTTFSITGGISIAKLYCA